MSAVPTESPNEDLNALSDPQRFHLPKASNDVALDYPSDRCVHHLFQELAELSPDSIALVWRDCQLTYRQLDELSNQLAHRLQHLGARPGDRVALLLDRTPEFVISVLAVLKTGGVYVPLATEYPIERLRFMLQDCDASLLITQQTLPHDCDLRDLRVLNLAAESEALSSAPKTSLPQIGTADALAYIMYTSGSTGQPKGVCVPHRGIVRLVRGQTYADFSPTRRFLLLAPVSFDASTFELWGPLLNGATCVIYPHTSLEFDQLEVVLRGSRISCLWLTAGLFNQIIDLRPAVLSTVEHVITGGDALSVPHVQRALSMFPQLRLTNGYGPTESTTFACCYEIPHDHSFPEGSVPIGRPIANTRCYVLDESGQPTQIGVPGELCIGGDGLAAGYWSRPELTTERFVSDPFSSDSSARMYRTGDFARYLDDGNLEFLGRRDQQVKIRGFRIELEDIEAVLGQHPDVNQCAVVVQIDEAGEKQLVAALVLGNGVAWNVHELRNWLAAKLPDYMIPARFTTLDTLPLTPNGKLDRTALASLESHPLSTGAKYVAPTSTMETLLVQIWQEVLRQHEPIGIHDHFLDLGGHSLLAMRIVSQLNSRLALRVPVRWILAHPTIAELAKQMEMAVDVLHSTASMPVVSRQAALPMSFGQQRFWILQETLPDPATYNVPVVHRLTGPVDPDLLQTCLRALVDRHEALRTALIQDGDSLRQEIAPIGSLALPWHEADWRAFSIEEQEAAIREEVRRPFDLRQAPLWRVLWPELGPDEHLFALTFHHTVVDAWSLRLFFHELEQLYAAGGNAEKAGLLALPMQYADFAVWQREQLSDERRAAQETYWARQLKALPPPLELPADRPRPVRRSGRGGLHRFTLSKELTAKLRQVARQEETSLFNLILASSFVWLYRHTGQSDIVVGTPVSQRNRRELEPLMGFFLNTLPIRVTLNDTDRFRELCARVTQTVRTSLEHSDLPFEDIVALVGGERDVNNSPLFEVMVVLMEEGVHTWTLGSANATLTSQHTDTSKYDLLLTVVSEGPKWSCELEFATDLFTPQRAVQLTQHWTELLQAIVADLDAPVDQLNLLPPTEAEQIAAVSRRAVRDYHLEACVHHLFEDQVCRTPQAEAIRCQGRSLTYDELSRRANRLAHRLRQLGVEPDHVVGLCVERSLEMVIGILGILKAGAAYLPLDPAHPRERLAVVLDDSQARVLVTQRHLADTMSANVSHRLFLDDHFEERTDDTNPACEVTSRHLAYVMYTSGSTGIPKGVCIEHHSVVNFLHAMQESLGIDAQGRFLAVTTISFDMSLMELLLPLTTGALVVIATDIERMDASALTSLAETEEITVLQATPALWREIVASGWHGSPQITGLTAGEALPTELAREMRKRFGSVWNLYGPTETGYATATRIDDDCEVTIGQPIANTRAYILDHRRRPVPIGVTGELYIGGEGVARGYWRRPELTAERFLSDPFDASTIVRIYRTGDLARWRENGDIEYLGRADQQVKIRGFRVELEEIEAVLESHPSVARCAVVVQSLNDADQQLTALLVPSDDTTAVDPHALRRWLSAKLPSYMVPARFAVLDTLPLSPNGKIDRKKLANWHGTTLSVASDFLAPRTAFEAVLTQVWQDLFQLEQVGIRDDFFALGGHSLLAVRAVGRIQEATGIPVSLSEFLASPTIERLAQALDHTHPSDPLANAVYPAEPIPQADRQQNLSMSFGQKRFWILQQMLQDSATYNMPVAHRLVGPVNVSCLKKCLRTLLEGHEVLRTALRQEGDEYLQQILPADALVLPWCEADWTDLTRAEWEAALGEEVRKPFELAQAPLWRVLWSAIGPNEHLLTLTFHHSIVDEWSLRVFFRELEQLYAAGADVERAGLAALPVQYADYAVWQRQRLTEERRRGDAAYWAEQLRDPPPPLPLPADMPQSRQRSDRGAVQRFSLPQEVVGDLRRLARAEGVSLFTLMLAAYQVWLYRYTGQEDALVSTPVAARDREELQGLIGYFLNTLPIRTRLTGQASFRETLEQVRTSVMTGLEHGAIPFEQIVSLAGPASDGSRTPLHQVMFVLLEEELGSLRLEGSGVRYDESCFADEHPIHGAKGVCAIGDVVTSVHTGTSKCDLLLSIVPEGDQWVCELEYATDLFSVGSVQRMAAHWQELLWAIANDPTQRIDSLNLLTATERQRLLETWNDTQRPHWHDLCWHQLFEEQVSRTPLAEAIRCEGESLTYVELNRRANQLAHRLRQQGVASDDIVGLCAERSLEMVVGIVGILKAGGAYLPLDPRHPKERLALIVKDSRTSILVTQSHLAASLPVEVPHRVLLDDFGGPFDYGNPHCETSSRRLAYVMYTSGSTGIPKGVCIEHRSVANFIHAMQELIGLDESDRFLALTTVSFDISVLEILLPLTIGAQVVIATDSQRLDIPDLVSTVESEGISVVQATPALWHALLASGLPLPGNVKALCGGEALPDRLAVQLTRQFGTAWNLYGPTETTVWSTAKRMNEDGGVTIGRPIANTRVYILDRQRHPVPVGITGELYIGGDGVARGYWQRPELTAERFLPDPFDSRPDARMYRTGDLARWREDGDIEYLGRADQQVKIRGYRIELEEIEAVLETHPGIARCAVVVQPRGTDDKQLTAMLVPRDKTCALNPSALREYVAAKLPSYMVPSHFAVLDALPLSPNGKVDRQVLSRQNSNRLELGREYVAPCTDLERMLVEIWQDLLNRERIGVHDNFFELGGNSLTAVQVISRIQAQLGRLLPVADLFANPTVGRFAGVVNRFDTNVNNIAGNTGRDDETPPIFLLKWYLDVSDLALANRKCYVIPFPDISDSREHCCIEYIATRCLETLREVQPHGPYYLIGYSLAGLVAYEMTRRLRAAGEEVAFLVIIDTAPPLWWQRTAIETIALAGKVFHIPFATQLAFARRVLNMFRYFRQNAKRIASHPWRTIRSMFKEKTSPANAPGNTNKPTSPAAERQTVRATGRPVAGATSWAYYSFAPQPLAGRVSLLLTEEMMSLRSKPGRYWRRLVEDLDEHIIPGQHLTCIREHKPALVARLRTCLEQAEHLHQTGD